MITLVAAFCAVAPVHDILDGSRVTDETRQWLPSGRHVGSVADLWFLELISMQQGGAGIAMFDPLYLSAHGRSWSQLHFLVDGFELTDPARSGRALIDIPHGAWHALEHRSLWTDVPSLTWTLPVAGPRAAIAARGGAPIGGPGLMGEGVFDRDPATLKGATAERRALQRAAEVEARSTGMMAHSQASATVEWVEHLHRYPTLRTDAGDGRDDVATRGTATLSGTLDLGVPLRWMLMGQELRRSHAGAEFRFPDPLTRRQEAAAVAGGVATALALAPALEIDLGLSAAWRREQWRARSDDPIVVDIEDQWLLLHRPSLPETLSRRRIDSFAVASLGDDEATRASLRLYRTDSESHYDIVGDRVGETYARAMALDDRAVAMTVYGPQSGQNTAATGGRLEATHELELASVTLRGVAALVHARLDAGRRSIAFTTPALGVAAAYPVGGGELRGLLRDEPQSMTSELAEFLHPQRLNGGRYGWADDGDAIPESAEQGALLARRGGEAHALDADLRAPAETRAAVSYRSPRFGPFVAMVSGIGRLARNRLTVRLSDPAASSYSARTFDDPGGDGLNETPRADGQPGQLLTVYDRAPGTEGQETYVLENGSRADAYLGAEVQLFTERTHPWFLHLGLSGYWSYGANVFGVFADRNDPGVIDEASADPNQRLHQWGRNDNDRSFAIHLMTGVEPLAGLRGALLLRYRDGEPITRVVVVDDLQQGPTAVMAVPRGDPWPRNTFHMTVDLRFSYELVARPLAANLTLDVFNALGSGTEVSEDLRTGPDNRRSLEMVPDRAALLGLSLAWL